MSKLIDTITRMRSREELRAVLDAATARDTALANIESNRASKRVMSRFADLKPGMSLFVHHLPRTVSERYKPLFGVPLTVISVRPKLREIEVRAPLRDDAPLSAQIRGPQRVTLRWSVLDRLGVSTEPTPEALAYALKGGDE